jgi:hypothetical protein
MPSLKEKGKQYVEQYGGPWSWFEKLINQESGWQHYDASGRVKLGPPTPYGRAVGVSQLLPSTAAGLGVNPIDPDQNIRGGAKYFAEGYKAGGADPLRALVYYVGGPGLMRGWDRKRASLPQHARDYLDAIAGRNWESIPPDAVDPPGPGMPTIPGLPSIPSPEDIGKGIWGGIVDGIKGAIVEPSIDTLIPFGMAAAGISLVSWGLVIAALKSPAGDAAITGASLLPGAGKVAGPALRTARRVT